MIVAVGSKNINKINGVRDAFLHYYSIDVLDVVSKDVAVEEFGHPKNLEETTKGAMERARGSFGNCDLSVGVESGLIEFPATKTGFMEGTVCALYDGTNFYFGLSPCLEWPESIVDGILNKGLDGSQAFLQAGMTHHPKIGEGEGIISIFTKGVIDRRKQIELSVIVALVRMLNPKDYIR